MEDFTTVMGVVFLRKKYNPVGEEREGEGEGN